MSNMLNIAVVIIAIFLIQDSHQKRPKKCASGVWGDPCGGYLKCKPGYTCIKRKCCRDPVCPKGWIEGLSCDLRPNHARCEEGYQCTDNQFCCRSTFCPSGSIGPKCSHSTPKCSCRGGNCCLRPVCPIGWTEDGICDLTPETPFCKPGFECNDDFCCRRPGY